MANQQRQAKPSVCYTLYQYREELQRSETRHLRLSTTKFILTDELISKTVHNLKECSVDDLQALKRELVFKKELKESIYRIRKLRKLGIENPSTTTPSTEL